jgi:hypothetical protein
MYCEFMTALLCDASIWDSYNVALGPISKTYAISDHLCRDGARVPKSRDLMHVKIA